MIDAVRGSSDSTFGHVADALTLALSPDAFFAAKGEAPPGRAERDALAVFVMSCFLAAALFAAIVSDGEGLTRPFVTVLFLDALMCGVGAAAGRLAGLRVAPEKRRLEYVAIPQIHGLLVLGMAAVVAPHDLIMLTCAPAFLNPEVPIFDLDALMRVNLSMTPAALDRLREMQLDAGAWLFGGLALLGVGLWRVGRADRRHLDIAPPVWRRFNIVSGLLLLPVTIPFAMVRRMIASYAYYGAATPLW